MLAKFNLAFNDLFVEIRNFSVLRLSVVYLAMMPLLIHLTNIGYFLNVRNHSKRQGHHGKQDTCSSRQLIEGTENERNNCKWLKKN